MNIQFFAEENEEKVSDTEVGEVQTDEEETDTVTEENKEESFQDENKNEKSEKVEDKGKKDADFYIQQRKNKKEEKNAYEEGRIKGLLEAYDNKNPFTGEEIKDKADQDEFLLMLEMKAKGLDPIQDFAKYIKEKQRNGNSQKTNSKQTTEKKIDINNEINEFKKSNPDVDMKELTKNTTFNSIYEDLSETVPLQKIYNIYQKVDKIIQDKVDSAKARLDSSSGSLKDNGDSPRPTDFKNMSSKDFKEYQEKVKSGLIKI